jgi:hypothetical protein
MGAKDVCFMKQVINGVVVGGLVLVWTIVGLLVGLVFASRYMVVREPVGAVVAPHSAPVDLERVCQSDGLVWLNGKPCGLAVVNNYGTQKTAPVHMLEPKVSDAHYQWGGW